MNGIRVDISEKLRDEAREYRDTMLKTDITKKVRQKLGYGELQRLKYEFKKFLVHTVIEGRRNIIGIDGFDGSRKTSISTELSNPSTIFAIGNVIDRVSLDKPTPQENQMLITQRYENEAMPGEGKTVFLDRSWNNRAFIQKLYGYCSPEQYEEFLETLAPELERFLEEYPNLKIRNFFFEITKAQQIKRLHERKEDPLRDHRYSVTDATAPEKYDLIVEQRDILSKIYHRIGIPFVRVKTVNKEDAMIALLKFLLQDEDYALKSKEIDFTLDKKIIQPTKAELSRVMASKI
ncbi:hypothetical protein LAT59_04575 [Candidatus Gracilibacteria bacterium]|nr:hypothetical protein [Candidatus Gracilibacteria bacterium]